MAKETTLRTAATLCKTIDTINATAFQLLHRLVQENGNEIRLSESNQIPYEFTDGYENERETEIYKLTAKGETVYLHPKSSWVDDELYITKSCPDKGGVPVTNVLKAVVKQMGETTAK